MVHIASSENLFTQTSSTLDVDAYLGIVATDISTIFKFVDDRVADGERIRRGAVARALTLRQAHGGTALGRGVMLPHAAVRRLTCARLVYVRLHGAIDIETPDHRPVRDVLTLLVRYPASPADQVLLERIRDPYFSPILIEQLRHGYVAEVTACLMKCT